MGLVAARRPEHADTARTIAFRPERWAETQVPNPWEFPQLPQPSDQVWTVLKAGETVHQEGELPKTN